MAKKKTAAATEETLAQAPQEGQAPTAAAQETQPGDEPAEGKQKSSWAPRTTIAIPLDEAAMRDQTKGEVARYTDGYDAGVAARIDSPAPDFKPSPAVNEPVKEHHEGRNTPRWKNKFGDKPRWHKEVENHPVAERLDMEERFESMAERRLAEKAGDREPTR